jgi:hypothetical protein
MRTLFHKTPKTREGDRLLFKIKEFAKKNNYMHYPYRIQGNCVEEMDPTIPLLRIEPNDEAKKIMQEEYQMSVWGIDEIYRNIFGYKEIRQYLMDCPSTKHNDYFIYEYGAENWVRKPTPDPDLIIRETGGKILLGTPVHLLDTEVQVLNYDKPESERVILVKGSTKPYRKFDGQYHRHCGGCPFPEGCVMCTLK